MINKFQMEENLIVKESIFIAFINLLKQKDYADITITEITKMAGVSRMAYYRNYSSKADIAREYMEKLFTIYKEQLLNNNTVYTKIKIFVELFKSHEEIVRIYIKSGLSNVLSNQIDLYMCDLFNNIDDIYLIQFASGGLFRILLNWAESQIIEEEHIVISKICDMLTILSIKLD